VNATNEIRAGQTSRRAAVLLALLGMSVRALIPMGYMPGDLLAGEFVVLCPVGLPASMKHHGHHGYDGAVVDADRACPIGSALQYAALPADEFVQPDPGLFEEPRTVFGDYAYDEVLQRTYFSRAPPQEQYRQS
jgi:hypothetical protein